MPKGRMLNKKICYDEKVSKLSLEATLLYTWCIPHLDVKGRLHGDPSILKGTVVPYISKLTHQIIEKCLKEMEEQELILLYGVERKYLQFNGFGKNQTIYENKESPSIIPTPDQLLSNSCEAPEEVKESKVKESKDVQHSLTNLFEEVWLKYPNKLGKKEALKHYKASVKTQESFDNLNKALNNYINYIKVKAIKEEYIKHGSTWFNNWQDWVEYKTKPVRQY